MHPWHAIRVRTRAESRVASFLSRKDLEVFLPTYKEARQYSDRIKKVDSALFPGYLFCRFDPVHPLPVIETTGVASVVGTVEEPEIAAIQSIVTHGQGVRPHPFLTVGQRVRIRVGAFAGVEGILLSIRNTDNLIVSIPLLQRSVSVVIDRSWI
jgi:transcription antitermination factor NusG